MCVVPLRLGIESAGDIEPLDDHGAIEEMRIGRCADQNARFVWRVRSGRSIPDAIVAKRAGVDEALSVTGDEKLLLRVTEAGQIDRRRQEGKPVGAGRGDRHHWSGNRRQSCR